MMNPSKETIKNSFYCLINLLDCSTLASSLASVRTKLLDAI